MGVTDDYTATRSLAELHQYFREHPVTGPEGHSYIPAGHAAPTTPSLPLNTGVTDHIHASVREIVALTRGLNLAAESPPQRVQDVYDWCRRNTAHAPQVEQQRRDTVIYRQGLEHAIKAGYDKVVRPLRCPECATFGLMWVAQMQRAVCTNTRCLDHDGLSRSFTLGRLAYEHVAERTRLADEKAT
jgi:hypothetical protein